MAWQDDLARVKHPDGRELIGASFRGRAFFVDDSDRKGGRRKATHEFIDGEKPEVDDLGKVANEFRITGYVLGPDYMKHRDSLLSALQDVAGPGDLIHPFYGHVRAQCGPVAIRESKADGGIATFQIEFSHAPVTASPSIVVNQAANVQAKAVQLAADTTDSLEAGVTVTGQPAFALQSIGDDLANVMTELKARLSPAIQGSQELARMSADVDEIVARSVVLIRAPRELLDSLLNVTAQLVDSIADAPLAIVKALIESYSVASLAAAIGDTDARVQERINQSLFADSIRTVLVLEAARIATGVTFESIGQATDTAALVVDALETLAATASSEVYPSIVNLRSAVLVAIPGDEQLARIQTIEQNTDAPSIFVSYRLYGNTDSAEDIVARNQVAHPGFVSGSLSVLSNV